MTSSKQSEDLITNVLDILPDKILELLPIRDAARTSVLSKQWRSNWLSLKRLVFDYGFFRDFFDEDGSCDWQECSNIISSILLNHDGPVHEFTLSISEAANEKCIYLGQWLSFLSKNQVKWIKISIIGDIDSMPISSNIFWCSELVHLDLRNLTLNPPPSGFTGLPKLRHLVLEYMEFSQKDIFPTLMAKCRKLATLKLEYCSGMGDIVIDIPSLEKLTIHDDGVMEEYIAFRDVTNLKSIALHLDAWPKEPALIETIDYFNYLASFCQLQCIDFGGEFCKNFLATTSISRLCPLVFKHVNKLSLDDLHLSTPDTLQNIFDMVNSCPYMKELVIYIYSSNNDVHPDIDCNKIPKAPHLVEVKITGITGSGVEIQLIEYLLTIGIALERLLFKTRYYTNTQSRLKISNVLLGIPRSSPKARLVCLG